MAVQYPLSDMLTRIRNAHMRGHKSVEVIDSKLNQAVAHVLKEEGYIINFRHDGEGSARHLVLLLKYHDGKPVIDVMDIISKPSRRVYMQSKDLPVVKNGLGIAIVSTSGGVMTAKKAKKASLGGEVLCHVI